MRSSKSRSRNKSNRQRSLGNVVNRVFDSSGPEGKVRGTPQQIIDKYLTLARDAQLSNDRVAEQSFLQHAEHYTRMLGEAQREQAERQAQNQHNNNNNQHQPQRQSGDEDARGASADQNQQEQPAQQGGDSAQPAAQEDNRPQQPQQQQRRASRAEPAPQIGLPDAVTADEEKDNGLVETPEGQAKPKRTRAPRGEAAPRSTTARPRRKPAAKAGDADAAAPAPAAEGDNG